jgi:hypothetical protein
VEVDDGGSGYCYLGRPVLLLAEAGFAILGIQCCYWWGRLFCYKLCYITRLALLPAALAFVPWADEVAANLGYAAS